MSAISKCCTCGFEWETGKDGTHSCVETLQARLDKISSWCDAYPLDIFPEPDFKKVAQVLKVNGLSLDAVSASNMRHVLDGIKEILG